MLGRVSSERFVGREEYLAALSEGGGTVLITGASSGIGKAAALEIGEAGGTMLLVARRHVDLLRVNSALCS